MALRRVVLMLSAGFVLATAVLTVSVSAESNVRIVRLSEVQGAVQIDRAAGDGFSRAFINLPLIERSRLRTGIDGRAEIEFEDGSALRLAPNSEVDFVRLALGDNGEKLTAVQLASGTVYANLHPKKSSARNETGDEFHLKVAHETVSVESSAHFRVALNSPDQASLAVLKGRLRAAGPSGEFEIAEKHSATIKFAKDLISDDSSEPAKKDTFAIAKNYEPDPSDAWDRQQTEYHDQYALVRGNVSDANAAANSLSLYSYGVSDLNYYGSFMTVPGYGNVWQPYFIGAGWSPFQDGAWAFYPGAGYMWVSGYPWGWMPYRYGNWAYASGFGWFWQPGYASSYYALPQVVNAPLGVVVPTAPGNGRQIVMVGRGLTANPTVGTLQRVTIQPGSAGLGVPRGLVGRLDKVSRTVARTDRPAVVSTPMPSSNSSFAPAFGAGSPSASNAGTAASRIATHTSAGTASGHAH